jgi:hypothetical protein
MIALRLRSGSRLPTGPASCGRVVRVARGRASVSFWHVSRRLGWGVSWPLLFSSAGGGGATGSTRSTGAIRWRRWGGRACRRGGDRTAKRQAVFNPAPGRVRSFRGRGVDEPVQLELHAGRSPPQGRSSTLSSSCSCRSVPRTGSTSAPGSATAASMSSCASTSGRRPASAAAWPGWPTGSAHGSNARLPPGRGSGARSSKESSSATAHELTGG